MLATEGDSPVIYVAEQLPNTVRVVFLEIEVQIGWQFSSNKKMKPKIDRIQVPWGKDEIELRKDSL